MKYGEIFSRNLYVSRRSQIFLQYPPRKEAFFLKSNNPRSFLLRTQRSSRLPSSNVTSRLPNFLIPIESYSSKFRKPRFIPNEKRSIWLLNEFSERHTAFSLSDLVLLIEQSSKVPCNQKFSIINIRKGIVITHVMWRSENRQRESGLKRIPAGN